MKLIAPLLLLLLMFAGTAQATTEFSDWNQNDGNNQTRLTVPTYDSSNQPFHPSILTFAAAWHGYDMWMADSPYPYNNDDYENPEVRHGLLNDRLNWSNSPVVLDIVNGTPFNCDPCLIYNSDEDKIYAFWIYKTATTTRCLKTKNTSDGTTWSGLSFVLPNVTYSRVSPSGIYEDNKFWIWTVNNMSSTSSNPTLYDSDGTILDNQTDVTIDTGSYDIIPWHPNVYKQGDRYYMLLTAFPNGTGTTSCDLYMAISSPNNKTYFKVYDKLLNRSLNGIANNRIYQSAMIFNNESDMDLVYSLQNTSDFCGLAYTKIGYNIELDDATVNEYNNTISISGEQVDWNVYYNQFRSSCTVDGYTITGNGNTVQENTYWNVTSAAEAASTSTDSSALAAYTDWTLESDIKIIRLTTTTDHESFRIRTGNGAEALWLRWQLDGLYIYTGAAYVQAWNHQIELNKWHKWRAVVDTTANIVDVYRDGTLIVNDFSINYAYASNNIRFYIRGNASTSANVLVDNLKLSSSKTPPPSSGNMTYISPSAIDAGDNRIWKYAKIKYYNASDNHLPELYIDVSADAVTYSGLSIVNSSMPNSVNITLPSNLQKRYMNHSPTRVTIYNNTQIESVIFYSEASAVVTFVNPSFVSAGAAAILFVAAAGRFAISAWRNRRRKRRN